MSYYIEDIFKEMIGKKLASVELDKSRDRIAFLFQDGTSQAFTTCGDCCSTSWIEHLEMPTDIDGATILAIDDSAPITQDHAAHDEENGGECIQVYNTSFNTDRGEIILEYRNSSNGYYGGSLAATQ